MAEIRIEGSDDFSNDESRNNLNLPKILISAGGLDSARSVSDQSRQMVSARSPSRGS